LILSALNRKHRKTLNAIWETPVRVDIRWVAVESLIEALDGEVREGNGSRVRFELNGVRGNFHRPHPGNDAKRYQVRALKEFLEAAGVEP
jgi:hypothetical protein